MKEKYSSDPRDYTTFKSESEELSNGKHISPRTGQFGVREAEYRMMELKKKKRTARTRGG